MAEVSDWEKIRMQNMLDLQSMVDEEFSKPDMQELQQELQKVKAPKAIKRRTKDRIFIFTGSVPLERRSSSRIANRKPEYSTDDLSDVDSDSGTLRRNKFMQDTFEMEHLDAVVFRPKIKRRFSHTRRAEVPFVAAEDVTERYIKNVAWRVVNKQYSAEGSSCHQCRQKTTDSKTYCRSGRCIGIRGQFCGVCLKNRYGENAGVALRDPNWACPPCRSLCNCSICRTRAGKMPTGILAPVAQNQGFKSVAEFLKHLQNDNNGAEPGERNKKTAKTSVTGDLLGFDEKGIPVMSQKEE